MENFKKVGFASNAHRRGHGIMFYSEQALTRFLDENNFSNLIRAHEEQSEGFKVRNNFETKNMKQN